MKTVFRFFLGVLFSFFLFSGLEAQDERIQDFILKLEKSLQARDFDSYLEAFSPELRDGERENLSLTFTQMKMSTATLYWANKGRLDAEEPRLFLQVIFQNPYSALVETWDLKLALLDGHWKVKGKKARGNLSQLFKLQIPAERVERVDSVEIDHVDLHLVFKNALVFYDNIPDLETALLILGDGRLTFSPSDESEKHQLELIYKTKTLEDKVEYAFLRVSNSFFDRNIKIQKVDNGTTPAVSQIERNKAAALFEKQRLRYFTIESSLSSEPLSFLPQGEEAVIEFQGKKSGKLAYVYSPFAQEEVTLYSIARNRFVNLYSPESERGKKRLVITFSQKFDVQHYDIDLDFQPHNSSLSAKARINVRAEMDGLDALKFRFAPELQILRIFDADRRELFFTQDKAGKHLYVYFLEPITRNKNGSIEIFYRGKLEPPEQLTDTLVHPQRTDTLVFVPPQFDSYILSHSSFWYPCPPDEDYFTACLKIIVPPEYVSVSNGLLLQQGKLNGLQQVTEIDKMGSTFSVYETRNPVKGLSFLVAKLSLLQEGQGSVPLFSYAASDVRSPKKNILDEAKKILEFYESQFGPFPFETLRVIQRLWITAGGLSPASFVILNDLPRPIDFGENVIMMSSSTSPVDLSQWREYYLAHELAHQWWGQGVTSARYRDQWLSEGLAQFSSVLYLHSKYGNRAFSSILNKFTSWTEKKAKWGPITLGSRLSVLDFDAYQAIIYNKTTLVLNMLLDLVGEDVFFLGLRKFFGQHKYSAATTGQFKKVMEEISGRDLDDFFALWFDSYKLPECRVRATVDQEGDQLLLRVRVDQLDEAFIFPLWVEWEEPGRGLRREKLTVEKKNQEFSLALQRNIANIKVNPDRAVPGKFTFVKG